MFLNFLYFEGKVRETLGKVRETYFRFFLNENIFRTPSIIGTMNFEHVKNCQVGRVV